MMTTLLELHDDLNQTKREAAALRLSILGLTEVAGDRLYVEAVEATPRCPQGEGIPLGKAKRGWSGYYITPGRNDDVQCVATKTTRLIGTRAIQSS